MHLLQSPSAKSSIRIGLAFAMSICVVIITRADDSQLEQLDFSRDVQPIFQQHCTECHGGVKQAGGISFLYRDPLLAEADSGERPVVPGNSEQSHLIERLTTDDAGMRMPPEDHGDPLTSDQIAIIRRWIDQGARWSKHWSYEPPKSQSLPVVSDAPWCRNRIDHFILNRLDQVGLAPSPPASKAQWLRRATLDLTGLPPTPQDLDDFQNDESDAADDRVVNRLLESPHFGQRWAAMWLDLARYADTMGYEKDLRRIIWPYRDYVIDSFNTDKPFDRFTIEQIAGDLLPDARAEQWIATAFHRNTQTNTEGGTDDEEFRIAAVIDRVSTTWQVWQGQTFNCCQCHHHPYDPFTQRDFYQSLAIFNSTKDCDLNNEFPRFQIPDDPDLRDRAVELDREIHTLRESLNKDGRAIVARINDWKPLIPTKLETTGGQLRVDEAGEIRAVGTQPSQTKYTLTMAAVDLAALRLEIIPQADDPASLPERGSLLSHLTATIETTDGKKQPIQFREVFADHVAGVYDPIDSLDSGQGGFGGYPKLHRRRWAVFVPEEKIDGGDQAELKIVIRHRAATTGAQAVTLRRFRFDWSSDPRLIDCASDPERIESWQTLREQQRERKDLRGVTIPVMAELPPEARRETRLFIRGNFMDKDAIVPPGFPRSLPAADAGNHVDRMALARWIVADDNPLTARVIVNRFWHEIFGTGIVETVGDFGSSGTPPSHPELLDDLAVRFRTDFAWSVKDLLREIVTSATYRQTSHVSERMQTVDPSNRWLARGPRNRLTSEMVRDQALAVSGLLSDKIGGPSVMPYQPDGVWQTVYNAESWKVSVGSDRYRRAIYTFWRRTSPYPSALVFDAPSREVCTARRLPTNTPLQALVTMNDPAFFQCAQGLAKRAVDESDGDIEAQIERMLAWATALPVNSEDTQSLTILYEQAVAEYRSDPKASSQLAGTPEQAALVLVANAILNLDRVLMK